MAAYLDSNQLALLLSNDNQARKSAELYLDAAKKIQDVKILHAGTAFDGQKIVANGGRVLNIVAESYDFKTARSKAYEAVDLIDWKEGFVRRDIAVKAE